MRQKYSYCEHCDSPTVEGETLYFCDYWKVSDFNGRTTHDYLIVCNRCYEGRKEWCNRVFPDNCERCGAKIEYGEFYFEKECSPHGLLPDEKCQIICQVCFQQQNN
jgi:hypothetical protein